MIKQFYFYQFTEHKSTKLNDSKYWTVSLTIYLNMSLNYQTVPFQAIQFSINHLFVHSLDIKQFYLAHR